MLGFKLEDTLLIQQKFDKFIVAVEDDWKSVKLQWERLENCWEDSQHEHFARYFEYLTEQYENALNECNQYSIFLQCKINDVNDIPIVDVSLGQQREINLPKENINSQKYFDTRQQENSFFLQKIDPKPPALNMIVERDNPLNSIYLIGALCDELVEILLSINSLSSNYNNARIKDCLNKFSEASNNSMFGENINLIKKQFREFIASLILSSNVMIGLVVNQFSQILNSPLKQAELVLSIPSKFNEYIEFGEKTTNRTTKVLNVVNQSNIKNDSLENINSESQNLNKFLKETLDTIQENYKLLGYDQDIASKWKDEEEKKRKRFQKQLEIYEEIRTEKLETSDIAL